MNVFIDNLKNHRKSVSLESIFGKDSLKLYKTCEAIWLGWLHPYKGCYEANIPNILDFNFKANIPFNSSFDAEYKKFTERWLEEHPEEKEKMAKSKSQRQANFDRQFKIVAKIASDHNATITWCGTNNAERGDQWMVSQNDEQLGVFTVLILISINLNISFSRPITGR